MKFNETINLLENVLLMEIPHIKLPLAVQTDKHTFIDLKLERIPPDANIYDAIRHFSQILKGFDRNQRDAIYSNHIVNAVLKNRFNVSIERIIPEIEDNIRMKIKNRRHYDDD
jgi:hypothetical protein